MSYAFCKCFFSCYNLFSLLEFKSPLAIWILAGYCYFGMKKPSVLISTYQVSFLGFCYGTKISQCGIYFKFANIKK